MNAATEFDLGPLTWVKAEIDLALGRAEAALGEYQQRGDASGLKFCRTHVHQVYGALSIVGLDGVTQVTERLEALLLAIEEGRVSTSAVSVAEMALGAIQTYLDDLIAGEPNQPLRLFPAHSALTLACGLPAPNPAELFYPNPGHRPPKRNVSTPPGGEDALKALVKAERTRYQKGFLIWLRAPEQLPAALEPMHQALANIEANLETATARSFWWVAQGLMRALPHIPHDDKALRQLLARIEAQIRHLQGGSFNVAERLMRDVLYSIALAPPGVSPLVDEVQVLFQLRSLIPDSTPQKATSTAQDGALRRLREALVGAEVAWNKVCNGNLPALPGFVQSARSIATLTEEIGNTDLKRLGQGYGAIANWLSEDGARYDDAVAMEVATATLLLQNAQENFRRLGGDFAQQVDLMVARLYACVGGHKAPGDDDVPLLDEMSRRAQERLLIAQVGREIQNNLAQIEQALDAFFRNPEKAQDISGLDTQIKQITGALAMLGHFGAVNDLKACSEHIQRFTEPGYQPAAEDFESVAQQLSQLGFFIDALKAGETSYDNFLQRLGGPLSEDEEEALEAVAVPSFESQLVQQKQETQSLFDAYRAAPEDERRRDELTQNLLSLQKGADLVADSGLGETAKTVLQAIAAGEVLEPDIGEAVSSIAAPQIEAPRPSAATLDLAQSSHEAIDAELLSIFLEEANEVLATIADQLALLQAKPENQEALTTIRRASHTLKGSGRMVGLTDLGETGWAMEQTLNLWLSQELAVTPDLLSMIADAHALFSRWVVALENSTLPPDPSGLVALTERLRGLESEAPEAIPTVASIESAAPIQVIELPVAEADNEAPAMHFDLSVLVDDLATSNPVPDSSADSHLEVTAAALEDLLVGEEPPSRSTPEIDQISTPPAPTLYDIFCTEARDHLHTLLDAYAVLDGNNGAPTTFEMTRAAHTLGGIAATVGLMPLNHLAITLEHALLRRSHSARPDSIEGLETVRQAIITLESMFDGLAQQQAPEEQTQLIAALNEIFLPAAQSPEPQKEAPPSAEITAPPAAENAPAPASATAVPLPHLQDELDEQLLPIFLEEADEQLGELTAQLRLWRGELDQDGAPRAIARLLHTFKGNARMAGAMNLGELTHLLETRVEDALHAGAVTAPFIDEIESGCDLLAQGVERIRSGEPEAPTVPISVTQPTENAAIAVDMGAEKDIESGQQATLRVRADLVDRLVNEAGELSIARTRIEGEMRSLKTSLLDLTENVIRLRRQLREIEIQAEGQIQARVAQSNEDEADFDPLELDRFTRFQELTRFMAESVNDVATVQQSLLKNLDDANAALIAQSRLNRSLQQELMGVRMLPFASQTERLYRIVRQTAKEVGKRANLELKGGQVELDRSVLDKMMAPLEHMLRNAVTHGIETREARLAAGKSEAGEITIALTQEGNEIILAMSDDGCGLDQERIRTRAESSGLLAAGSEISEAKLYEFIFEPGFSTASELSQVSGRGVGMDVVKTEVAQLGGRIEIVSQPGQGTSFRLYLPLTLAVTQTLLIRAGAQHFAIPSTMIEQVLELKEKPLAELRNAGEAQWLSQRYPFHYLPHLLGDNDAAPEAHRRYWVLLLRSGSQRVAVQVDELKGNREVVVKNIGAQLARVVGIAGATVLGDGEVVLILNPVALATRLPTTGVHSAVPEAVATMMSTIPTVMVVDDSLTVRKITSRLLTREGYQVILAKDGVDALEQLIDVMPDVVLSDIEMPRMDGFDLLRNIRADQRLKQLPVIMITSRTAEKHRNYAMEIGANHYLGKPFDEDELLRMISDYI
ncbi:MAG: Hpt domain-containing protein [Rhodocyclaceae bacterium]|nr:Hpt domain-containing protein [Rhodocyclaceae bacterium]